MPKKHNSYFSDKLERHIELDIANADTYPAFERLGKAISSPIRLTILKKLGEKSMNIVEIAELMDIQVSSAAFHVNCLESAGLIVTESQPGIRGSKRVCSAAAEDVLLLLNRSVREGDSREIHIDMPIGQYFGFDVRPTCGLANQEGYIEVCDNPGAFFAPGRASAQLLWFQQGHVEYRFPAHLLEGAEPRSIAFSLEVCSEAPGYRNKWPSDITFSINGHEIVTYTSPGDFGGRRGKLTPAWWTDGNTQYGLLKTISVNDAGAYLDEEPCDSGVRIEDLHLADKPYISCVIEIKADARYVGGINLFGEHFGNHAQGIVMHIGF